MAADYLTMEHEDVQAAFADIRQSEKALQLAEAKHCPSIREECYLSGDEVCDYLHISIRTLQTLRDTRKIPFTVVGERTILYPEEGIRAILTKNYRPARE